MSHFPLFHINLKKNYLLKIYLFFVEFYRFNHGLENDYNFDDIIKEGKYFIFVALIDI